MKKVIRLTENDLIRLTKRVLLESKAQEAVNTAFEKFESGQKPPAGMVQNVKICLMNTPLRNIVLAGGDVAQLILSVLALTLLVMVGWEAALAAMAVRGALSILEHTYKIKGVNVFAKSEKDIEKFVGCLQTKGVI
jgi:hypothetical protein